MSADSGFGSRRVEPGRTNRRTWLRRAVAGGAAAGLAPAWPGGGPAGAGAARPWPRPELEPEIDPRLIIKQEDPLNAETPVEYLASYLTPNELFFIRSHYAIPEPKRPWTVSITGLVDRELTLTLERLQEMEAVTITSVLQCSGIGRANYDPTIAGVLWDRGAVGNAEWTGVRLRDLLQRAGLDPEAVHVRFRGADDPESPDDAPWFRSLPRDRALDPTTLLVYAMNGEPLPATHGGPLRLAVPGWCGNHWMKWLRLIEAAREEATGPSQRVSYRIPKQPTAPGTFPDPETMVPITTMPVKSLFARPSDGQTIPNEPIELVGVAWSGDGRVERVEIAIGESDRWKPAELFGPDRPFGWRLWRFAWKPEGRGPVALRCRATDSAGYTQPSEVPWNPKGYLWNAVDRIEVQVKEAE